jgi:hypothetical protein
MRPLSTSLLLVWLAFNGPVFAQNQPTADRTIGEVTAVDADHRGITLKEDKGGTVSLSVGEKASVLRVPPGETDLKKATRITFGDIGVGDRLLAAGTKSGDKFEARTVVIMNKADVAQLQQREQEDWRKRGTSGILASLEPTEKTFVLTVGDKKYKVITTDKTDYRRYASDSAKYADSKESTIAEMKPGDQVRVLGNRDQDALQISAERVVSGTFTRVAGVINSVDAEHGDIKLTDLISKKSITILITSRSNTRRLPEGLANVIAQRFIPNGQSTPAPATSGRGGAAAGQTTDLSQLLDRLPTITLTDLKPGAAIILAGSPQQDTTHITAITVIAGIEPIVTAGANLVQNLIGGWNLGGGGGAGEFGAELGQ